MGIGGVKSAEILQTTFGADGFIVLVELTLRRKGLGSKRIRDPGSPSCDR